MWALTILSACVLLSFATHESVKLKSVFSEHRMDGIERDSCFLCTVCDPPLEWLSGNRGCGGFTRRSEVGKVTIAGDSNGEDVDYLTALLDNAMNGNDEVCLTSLLLVHKDEISRIRCRGRDEYDDLTQFSSDSSYQNVRSGNIYADYVSFNVTAFSRMYHYSYIFRCEMQHGEYLSWYVNGYLVQNFTMPSRLERGHLMPCGQDICSDAILLSNHPAPENSITSILLVLVVDPSKYFHVSCRAGEDDEERIDLYLQQSHFNQSGTSSGHSDSDLTSKKSSTEGPTSPSDNTNNTNDLSSTSMPSGNHGNTTSKASVILGISSTSVIIIIIVIILLVILAVVLLSKHRNRQKKRLPQQQPESALSEPKELQRTIEKGRTSKSIDESLATELLDFSFDTQNNSSIEETQSDDKSASYHSALEKMPQDDTETDGRTSHVRVSSNSANSSSSWSGLRERLGRNIFRNQ